tara:strand:+ start:192 stop:962 length:771 start_codon:yes stop_codon:yes gene_type:complete
MARIPRSDELIIVAYFLSKFSTKDKTNNTKSKSFPPEEFDNQNWGELYASLYSLLGDGRTPKTFRSSINQTRDEFDMIPGHDSRTGHKKEKLTKKLQPFHDSLKDKSRAELWDVVETILSNDDNQLAEEFGLISSSTEFIEGKLKIKEHKERERNSTLVREAKKRWQMDTDNNIKCEVCGFSFLEQYGPLGLNMIEAHHRTPLNEIKGVIENKIEDLAPVCSNCHWILHRYSPMISISEFRKKYEIGEFNPWFELR